MAEEETYASLRFVGSCVVPDKITQQLKLLPSHAWQKGECFLDINGNTRQRYNGLWLYDARGKRFNQPVEHIRNLMKLIQDRSTCWRDNLGNIKVDLCLWIVAARKSWSIYASDIDLIIEGGYDGFNITFIGIEDCQSSRRQGDCGTMLKLQLCSSEFACDECTVLRRGKFAYSIDKAISVFSKRIQRRKATGEPLPRSYISVEWSVGHGALYLSCNELSFFRALGCSRIDFAFKNV